jgi:AraC-like DNA-binding protein
MAGGLTTFEVGDPHETSSVVRERLPASERSRLVEQGVWSRTYEAADRGRFRAQPESYRSRFAMGHCGPLRLSCISDARGTGFTIQYPGMDAYCISVSERGASRLAQPASRFLVDADRDTGLIFSGREATRLVTSDGNTRLQLWVPASLMRRSLVAALERPVAEPLEFAAAVDWRRGPGASVRRLVRHAFAELRDPSSLLSAGIGAPQFVELLIQSVLRGLPHNYTSALAGQKKAMAAPRNVRRAEEFLYAHAADIVTLDEVARAAGCSIRSLQLAFRRFRGTTPMAAPRSMRLQRAREEIIRPDGPQSVIAVALKYGFANPGRFADQYRRAFGELPSEALRARGLSL